MLITIPGCSILIHHQATTLTEQSIILSSPCQLGASSVCPGTWLIKVGEFSISFYISASRFAFQHENKNPQCLSRRLDMEQVYLSRCNGLPTSLMPEESGIKPCFLYCPHRTVMHTQLYIQYMSKVFVRGYSDQDVYLTTSIRMLGALPPLFHAFSCRRAYLRPGASASYCYFCYL
jgi:hypothetical protein